MEDVYIAFSETPRVLQAGNSTVDNITETEIIKSTCALYGSIFAVLFLLFIIVRPRYPHVYNLKKTFPGIHSSVADDSFGQFSWCRGVFGVSYDGIRDQCGMDAMTTIRLLEFGMKLSFVGVLNSVFLLPVYALMGDVVANSGVSDPVKVVSLSNLAQGNSGAIATTFAAYTLFGAAMYFVVQDFQWFTAHRHRVLSEARVQNYSIYLAGLPPNMQTNKSLQEYFRSVFRDDDINVHVALSTTKLRSKVAKRDALIVKFEHAINIQTIKGEIPMHKSKKCGGEKVESIPTFDKDLEDLNEEIETLRKQIVIMHKDMEAKASFNADVETGDVDSDDDNSNHSDEGSRTENHQRTSSLSKSARDGASMLKSAVMGGEDGAALSAAFVSFRSLASTNIARQTVHQHEPWSCVPLEPPMPEVVK